MIMPTRSQFVQPDKKGQPRHPSVLLVEYRDTVYRRLAADLAQAGFRTIRAFCATEGIIRHVMLRPDLVIANVELPDQSGWLLTAKLALTEPRPHVWLYSSQACSTDAAKARWLGAEELLVYGTLDGLADAVLASLAGDRSSLAAARDRTMGTVPFRAT